MDYRYIVIEDDTSMWSNIKQRMSHFSKWKACEFAEKYHQAVQLIKQYLPQLIFMDWSLKGGNAFDLLQEIENTPSYQPYIIFFTGFQSDRPDIPEEVMNRYRFVQKYLVKPIHEKLTKYLSEYVQEAEKLIASNARIEIWLEDYFYCQRRINPYNCMAIVQHTSRNCNFRNAKKILLDNNESIIVRKTWEECILFCKTHNIDYLITHQRKSIVNKKYIDKIQNQQIYLNNGDTIEVSRQQWKVLKNILITT